MPTAEALPGNEGVGRLPVAGRSLGPTHTQGRPERGRPGARWIYSYLAVQLLCQLALLVSVLAPARVVFRSLALGTSLLFLVLIPARRRSRHPSEIWGIVALVIVGFSALNPDGGAPLAVVAHLAFYVAVLAPLFWVGRLETTERTLVTVLTCLWVFHTASSIVGMLQVAFPGRFQPALTTFIDQRQVLTIRLSSGEWVARPMGLTDTPGGAGPSGFYATLLGLGIALSRPFRLARAAGILSMVVGMICVYVSEVRVMLVLLGVCFVVLVALFMLAGRLSGVAGALLLGASVVLVSFQLAFSMGGDMMVARLSSLTEDAPMTVYQRNRGAMLEDAFAKLLPKYPFGAGLGHWGMMNAYFGSREDEIGAELQWSGWILDGGAALTVVYTGGILAALWGCLRESLRAMDPARRSWVAIITAYDVATLAMCFSYVPFMSTTGLEFWLLNALALHATLRQPRAAALVPSHAVP